MLPSVPLPRLSLAVSLATKRSLDEIKAMALMLREQFPDTALAESAFPLSPSLVAFVHEVPSLVSQRPTWP
jgi:hypothetical protein